MEKEKLDEILCKHHMWLKGEEDGKWANLRGADLRGANLTRANLKYTDLL